MIRIRLAAAAALLTAAFATLGAPAFAHAIIEESTPAPAGTAVGPDVAVTLRYNTRIDRARSRLTLLDAADKSAVIAIDPKGEPNVLTTTIKGLVPGAYRVRWQVLAVDGHITRGEVPFKVEAP